MWGSIATTGIGFVPQLRRALVFGWRQVLYGVWRTDWQPPGRARCPASQSTDPGQAPQAPQSRTLELANRPPTWSANVLCTSIPNQPNAQKPLQAEYLRGHSQG
uniref:Uncharacterized protein n=1 Tax=Eutreptiella gymnastica TaxID=73025 RepID=A0A7S1NIT3_9EUGL|mmetsp:Transcript_42174/g.75536  ORF Transcript_42174/g.75536 Transcript_42174/m.75536 type:complete len:104 (+) Transcript_42174:136-447(+)